MKDFGQPGWKKLVPSEKFFNTALVRRIDLTMHTDWYQQFDVRQTKNNHLTSASFRLRF